MQEKSQPESESAAEGDLGALKLEDRALEVETGSWGRDSKKTYWGEHARMYLEYADNVHKTTRNPLLREAPALLETSVEALLRAQG